MAAGRTVEDILAGAKETLSKSNALSDSVEKEKQKDVPPLAPPRVSGPPKHEYSRTPYSIAKEARSAGEGIKAGMEMRAKAQKALQ